MVYSPILKKVVTWKEFVNLPLDIRREFAREIVGTGKREVIIVQGPSPTDVSAVEKLLDSQIRACAGINEARKVLISEEYFQEPPVYGPGYIIRPEEA
jgi:hypothetical protein